MRYMRARIGGGGIAPLLLLVAFQQPADVAAQATFEGVITAVSITDGERDEMVLRLKGSQWRLEMEMDGDRGAIIRDRNGRVLSLIEETRQYHVFPVVPGDDEVMEFTALGRTETVAGLPCEYYRIRDPNGLMDGDQACITKALGFVGFSGAAPLSPADERAIRRQFGTGFFILKLLDSRGGTSYTVTSVERVAVSDAMFAPPAGYTELRMPRPGGER
jgi:hypothetical protein